MADLILKERGSYTVEIKERKWIFGEPKVLRVPFELTVMEIKRLLEMNSKIERLSKEELDNEDFDATLKKMNEYWGYLFAQVTIIMQHFQPEITQEYLEENLTQSQALELTNFFEINRSYQSKKEQSSRVAKKKWSEQLEDLNRIITFMVYYGFDYTSVMGMYFDEFIDYHAELYNQMEMAGVVKEGSYKKIKGIEDSSKTINEMFGKMSI